MTNKFTSKENQEQESILSQALANMDRPQPTPLGVFKLARKFWLEGRRVSIGDLAKEVGVSRVTLYRWVGSREGLIEEIFCSFAKPTFENAVQETPGNGVTHIVGVHRHFMSALAEFEPLQRYVCENPTVAIRIQTSKDPKSCHNRVINAAADHIEDQAA
ncbi:MAG: TetR family transcriptional regulator, partial [Desulfatitalea sp.]|nr:TetR family transcriptional regulator [Desulfatitalea sp.]